MLIRHAAALPPVPGRDRSPGKDDGVVLMVALIILVALTISGIALIRSVDTTNIISGNLAFQQSATHAAEMGTEDALATFLQTSAETALYNDSFVDGYAASTPAGVWLAPGDTAGNPDPALWDTYWLAVIDPQPKAAPVAAKSCGHGGGRACTLPTDTATGNTVSYTIQRLCGASGDPAYGVCASSSGRYAECHRLPCAPILMPTQYYYRITSRVSGPRNTISYVQAIVAISKN